MYCRQASCIVANIILASLFFAVLVLMFVNLTCYIVWLTLCCADLATMTSLCCTNFTKDIKLCIARSFENDAVRIIIHYYLIVSTRLVKRAPRRMSVAVKPWIDRRCQTSINMDSTRTNIHQYINKRTWSWKLNFSKNRDSCMGGDLILLAFLGESAPGSQGDRSHCPQYLGWRGLQWQCSPQ